MIQNVIYNICKRVWRLLPVLVVLTILGACANIARPGGGPRDIDAPRFIKSEPAPLQTNYKKTKIDLHFDEIVTIDNPAEKVVVSPAQKEPPMIRSNGRKITVDLKDSLRENTTYSIDFTDAISDNNEKNKLENFGFAFSTGPVIDTLEVYGYLLNAENLEPITGMLVGLHRKLDDSAFVKEPLDRLALSDSYGRFSIRNIAPGTYRIYALKDVSRNFYYDAPNEDIAFDTTLITPWLEMRMHADTIWADSITVDTVRMVNMPHYFPNDIVLRSFNENYKQQYLDKTERLEEKQFKFYFNDKSDTLPAIKPLNFEADDWYFLEPSIHNDTLTYWIKDSTIYKKDTLEFALTYLRTDSLKALVPYNDTVSLVYKRPKPVKAPKNESKRKRKVIADSLQQPQIPFLDIKIGASQTFNIYERPIILSPEPILAFDTTGIHLAIKKDSTFTPVPFTLRRDSMLPRRYFVVTKFAAGETYKLSLDSAVITGLYGLHNNKAAQEFTVKKLDTYSRLNVMVRGITGPAFVQILNGSDAPIAQEPVKNGKAVFRYLDPGKYYMRLVVDNNKNGRFDPGNLLEKRQPEMVYYYPGMLELRPNWVADQDWDVLAKPLYEQKPRDIVKNKPKEPVETNEEDYLQQQNSNSMDGGMSSFGSSFGGGGMGRFGH